METISKQEVNAASSGVFIFAHSIEKFMRIIEEYYVQDYERSDKFKQLVSAYYADNIMKGMSPILATQIAKQDADRYVRDINKRALMNDSVIPYGKYLNLLHQVIEMTDLFTEQGMENNTFKGDNKAMTAFDYMMGDSDRMCRLFCRFSNVDDKDDAAEEAVMRYETKPIVGEDFINKWFRTKV